MIAAETRQNLIDWISRQSDAPAGAITGATPLIADGWLSSLQILDLLLFLEELRGDPVDPRALVPGAFHDVDTIVARFLGGVQ